MRMRKDTGTQMTDEIWQRDEVDSPCVKICIIHPETRLCLGCRRSIDEISRWSGLTPEQRRDIVAVLPDRDPGPKRRSGGASARRAARRG
jgi:predicted Fe-S protein YdhL (DUF1289 family)